MSFEFTRVADITFISRDAEATAGFYETIGLPKLEVAELDVFRLGADSVHLTDPDGNHLEIHQEPQR